MSEVPSLNTSSNKRRGSISHKNYQGDPPTRDKQSSRNLISESDFGSSPTFKNIMENISKREEEYKKRYWELSPAQELRKQRIKKEDEKKQKKRNSRSGQEDSIIEVDSRRDSINQQPKENDKEDRDNLERSRERNESPVEIQTGGTTIQIYSPQGSRIVVGQNSNNPPSYAYSYVN